MRNVWLLALDFCIIDFILKKIVLIKAALERSCHYRRAVLNNNNHNNSNHNTSRSQLFSTITTTTIPPASQTVPTSATTLASMSKSKSKSKSKSEDLKIWIEITTAVFNISREHDLERVDIGAGTRRESEASTVAWALVRLMPPSLQWYWFYKRTMWEREIRWEKDGLHRWTRSTIWDSTWAANRWCGEDKWNSCRFYKRTDTKGLTFRVGSIKEPTRKAVELFASVLYKNRRERSNFSHRFFCQGPMRKVSQQLRWRRVNISCQLYINNQREKWTHIK